MNICVRWALRTFIAFALLLFGGCLSLGPGSQASRYYLLGAPTAVETAPAIAIAQVTVPRYLQRSQMVTRVTTGEMCLHEFARWGEPLDAGVARVLSAALSRLGEADYRLDVDILAFGGEQGGNVILDVAWMLSPVKTGEILRGRKRYQRVAAGPDMSDLVTAMNGLLAEFADDLRTAVAP